MPVPRAADLGRFIGDLRMAGEQQIVQSGFELSCCVPNGDVVLLGTNDAWSPPGDPLPDLSGLHMC